MGFWKRLFKRKEKLSGEQIDWDEIVYERDQIDFQNEEERGNYITSCLEQITDATKEVEALTGEYNLVTSYLTDLDEVEALPDEEKEKLTIIAQKLEGFEQEKSHYKSKKNRMSDSDFYQLKGQEDEAEEGIRKLKEAEKYQVLVKQDMHRLDSEHLAYEYRIQELESMLTNFRGMAVIFLTALVVCLGLLVMFQMVLEMNTTVGYMIAIVSGVGVILLLSLRYMDAEKELIKVKNASNKLVLLQNKVKIRYINNTHLLDYLYMKYNVDSGVKLEKRFRKYLQEKEERKQFTEAEARIEYYQKQLVLQLSKYPVKSPERFIHQVGALLDKREMVEIRHELITRRQALRSQLDYNLEIAKNAKVEVKDLAVTYPKYAGEITAMISRFEQKYR